MPITGTSNQHADRSTKPLITAPPHLKSPAYFRRYPCPYCSRRFWKPEHMEGHLTRCTHRSTRTGLKRRRTDVASPNSMPLEAKGIYGFRPRAVSEPRGKVSRKQQTPVDTPTCVSVSNEQHVRFLLFHPR
ncbi:hypothetical protein FGIG_04713 [Fasciola gigantica]|uniref:C2H2-type domain-containing protein n=1 Tax=Fasciola gigantica TaxID=46835 RepID=A0A504Z3X7_FASGI|nr:hypothetical protein FGIG_04713 [Fasciola gigantica]